jgi:hypothetical protein
MLKQDELTGAIIDAQKSADICGQHCRLGAVIDDGHYMVHHNGIGTRDTDSQAIHASGALGLNQENLAKRLEPWIKGLHRGERVDLNASMATGGPIDSGSAYIVGERGPDLFVPAYVGRVRASSLARCRRWMQEGD